MIHKIVAYVPVSMCDKYINNHMKHIVDKLVIICEKKINKN